MKVLVILGVTLLTAASGRAETKSAVCGFESAAGFNADTEIRQQKEWAKSAAGVKVSAEKAKDGTQSLELPQSPNDTGACRDFTVPVDGIVFTDFAILPEADASLVPQFAVDAGGARLGFIDAGGRGNVVTVSEDGKSTVSKYEFPIDPQNRANEWIRVTVRADFKTGTWDLYLDGKLVLIDQPLVAGANFRLPAVFSVFGNATGPVFLDDLSISDANPLFADADKDGIPDAVEAVAGTDPTVNDRSRQGLGGATNLQRYLEGNGTTDAAGRKIVYVDNQLGSDLQTGEMSYPAGRQGPKASLSAALKAAPQNAVIALLPSARPYKYVSDTQTQINLLPVGSVTLEN